MCIYVHIYFTIYRHWSDKRNKKIETALNEAYQEKFPGAILGTLATVSSSLAQSSSWGNRASLQIAAGSADRNEWSYTSTLPIRLCVVLSYNFYSFSGIEMYC